MTAIVVDPGGMRAAAVVLAGYLDALELSVRALDAVTLPAGVPPAQQALVSRALNTARLDLLGALRMITGLPADLRRRVSAAERADDTWPLALDLGKNAFGVFAGSFLAGVPSKPALAAWKMREGLAEPSPSARQMWTEYRKEATKAEEGVGAFERSVPRKLRWGARGLGGAVNVAAIAYTNFSDPSRRNLAAGRAAQAASGARGANSLGEPAGGRRPPGGPDLGGLSATDRTHGGPGARLQTAGRSGRCCPGRRAAPRS
jgi:hypothetical protein